MKQSPTLQHLIFTTIFAIPSVLTRKLIIFAVGKRYSSPDIQSLNLSWKCYSREQPNIKDQKEITYERNENSNFFFYKVQQMYSGLFSRITKKMNSIGI